MYKLLALCKYNRIYFYRVLLCCCLCAVFGWQAKAQKSINHNPASWTGVFASYRLNENWGVTGDLLFNRNNFYADPGFTWVKIAPAYWSKGPYFFSAGMALLWVPRPELSNASHTLEYRLDPQVVTWKPIGKGTFLSRFRLDLRSRQDIANGEVLGTRNMSYRLRYLFSYTYPITKGDNPLSVVVLNELLIQFGDRIVYNTFDQIRLFVGVHKRLSNTVSYDFGYFPIYSQLPSGNQYNLDHIIRLFVYTDFKSKKFRNIKLPILEFGEQ